MLKYGNSDSQFCSGEGYDLNKCNTTLKNIILQNTEFLQHSRCLFMTYKEYTDKEHINNNIYCRVFRINETKIYETIKAELIRIKNTMLRPDTLIGIPLPIYAMMAKVLDENIFKGDYEVILYIPNLYNYNIDDPTKPQDGSTAYTLFPSLDAFSKQNRWMELMTSKYSKYLDIITRGSTKDREKAIIRKNYFRNDLTNICLNLGCVSTMKENIPLPEYDANDDKMNSLVPNSSPYLPNSCLQTPYYNIHMMDFKEKGLKQYRGTSNILSTDLDITTYCSAKNIEIYKKGLGDKYDKSIDKFVCEKIGEGKGKCIEDPSNSKKIICTDANEKDENGNYVKRALDLPDFINAQLSEFNTKYIEAGTDDENYSILYNNNILKELSFRNSKYPGPDALQEVIFSMFRIDETKFSEDLFCTLPWGDMLLKQDYVINEEDTLEIDRVSFKSFNKEFEIKFDSEGYLYLYKNNNRMTRIPHQSGSLKCFKRRVLKFENMVLNIYGYDDQNNYDLRGFVKIIIKNMYITPASLILSNINGNFEIYDLGINKR
jgi:hypothetical protein